MLDIANALMTRRAPVLVMETDTTAVTAGSANPGWVSGSLQNLATTATAWVTFDLGPAWHQYTFIVLQVVNGTVSTGGGAQGYASDDGISLKGRLSANSSAGANSAQYMAWDSGVASSFVNLCRPSGRFVRISCVNGSSAAQAANCSMRLTAYPS